MKNSQYRRKKGLAGLWGALKYSYYGLRIAFREEAAFRSEVMLAVILVPLAMILHVSRAEKALLIGSLLLMLLVELLNSAVEATVDRISYEKHHLAAKAKDISSAAVFVSVLNCVVIWGVILI